MNRVRIPFRSVVSAAILLCLVWALFPQGASQAAPKTPTLSWKPCYQGEGFPFECADVKVPLDYSKPGSAAISIARFSAVTSLMRSRFFTSSRPSG